MGTTVKQLVGALTELIVQGKGDLFVGVSGYWDTGAVSSVGVCRPIDGTLVNYVDTGAKWPVHANIECEEHVSIKAYFDPN